MSQQVRAISMKSDDLSLTPKIHMMGEQTQVVPDLYIYTMLSPTYTIVKFFKESHWTDLHIPEGESCLSLVRPMFMLRPVLLKWLYCT